MKFLIPLVIVLIVVAACTRREGSEMTSTARSAATQPVVAQTDESEARLAIYTHYMKSDSRVYVVDESELLIGALSARTKKSVFHPNSGAQGWKLSIVGLKISGDVAQAGFAAVGGNTGAELFSVRLRKTGNAWEVVEWRLNAAS